MMLGLSAVAVPTVINADPLASINAAYNANPGAAATIALTTPESALVLNPGGAVVTPGVTPPAICPGSPGCPGYTAPGAAQPAPCELSGNCGSCSDGSDPLALGLNSDGSAMFSICQQTLMIVGFAIVAGVVFLGTRK